MTPVGESCGVGYQLLSLGPTQCARCCNHGAQSLCLICQQCGMGRWERMEYMYFTVCEWSWLLVDRALVIAKCPALAVCFLLYLLSRDT